MVAVEQTFTHLVKILHPNNILSPEDERKTDFRLLGWVCKSGRAWGEGCPFCWHAPAQSALALLNSTPQPPRLHSKQNPWRFQCVHPLQKASWMTHHACGILGSLSGRRNLNNPWEAWNLEALALDLCNSAEQRTCRCCRYPSKQKKKHILKSSTLTWSPSKFVLYDFFFLIF